ncbi:hypothetical protein AgCh_013909 [Apium graveolens]
MASTSNIIQVMSSITLDDEKGGGLAIHIRVDEANTDVANKIDAKLGLVEKLCSHLFEVSESEIILRLLNPTELRAPLRRHSRLIGSKWLREGGEDSEWNTGVEGGDRRNTGKTNLELKKSGITIENQGGSYPTLVLEPYDPGLIKLL